MVEVNLNPETPSQAIVSAANASVTVTDAKGRKIVLTKLKALDRMRLFEAVGANNVGNQAYFGYASLAFHVTSIDDVDVPKPSNKMQLEALVQRLGDEGLDAAAKGIEENFISAVLSQDEAKEAVKNG